MSAAKHDYEYPEKDCDVVDKAALKEFRKKRLEWIGWLNDGDNAIWRQIHTMIWSDRLFWMVNESRRIAGKHGGEFAARSGWLGEMIDQGYYATQLLALRKLTDPPNDRRGRQVISLRRLLDDLKAHKHVFIREIYVCHDGLRFDPAEAEKAYWAGKPSIGVRYEKLGGPLDYTTSRRMHGHFNAMTNDPSGTPNRSDLIRDDVFDGLDNRLSSAPLDKVRILANKRIAHAPDATSIPKSGLPAVTFKELWDCQQAICEVAGFVSTFIVQESTHGVVPIPQLDMFDRWDKPFIPAGSEKELRDIWEKTSKERDLWGNQNISKMLEKFRAKSSAGP
jgi:hypothetical protein